MNFTDFRVAHQDGKTLSQIIFDAKLFSDDVMDERRIRLYPDGDPGRASPRNWELLLNDKKITGGNSSGTQEMAFTAARAALAKEQARKAKRD